VAKPIQVFNSTADRQLVKSRRRVQDHAEVLTPAWLVDDMLDLVGDESARIDSRFLEPACGDGNFLVRVLDRKLSTTESRYGKSAFEMRHQALLALMSIYGIEIQADNAADCRSRLLLIFREFLDLQSDDDLLGAARTVLEANIVRGDALAMTTVGDSPAAHGCPIVFAEWGYLGRGKYQRRDFRFDALASRSTVQVGDAHHEVFQSVRMYPPMTVRELAR
jgi:hypothetical protein